MEDVAESFTQAKHESKITGSGKIVASFDIENKKIAGTQITKGKIKVGDKVIIRGQNGEGIAANVASIKKFKKEVESAMAGQECGIALNPNVLDFHVGDIIESLGQ
jgi:translation initiation factor IF-2